MKNHRNYIIAVVILYCIVIAGYGFFSDGRENKKSDRSHGRSYTSMTSDQFLYSPSNEYWTGYRTKPEASFDYDAAKCSFCGGDGYVVCPDCKGSGKMDESIQGVLRALNNGRCQRCDGSGKVYCSGCYGKGYIK